MAPAPEIHIGNGWDWGNRICVSLFCSFWLFGLQVDEHGKHIGHFGQCTLILFWTLDQAWSFWDSVAKMPIFSNLELLNSEVLSCAFLSTGWLFHREHSGWLVGWLDEKWAVRCTMGNSREPRIPKTADCEGMLVCAPNTGFRDNANIGPQVLTPDVAVPPRTACLKGHNAGNERTLPALRCRPRRTPVKDSRETRCPPRERRGGRVGRPSSSDRPSESDTSEGSPGRRSILTTTDQSTDCQPRRGANKGHWQANASPN